MPGAPLNHLRLTAAITELSSLRFTPAGIPAVDLRVTHESEASEAGVTRQLKVVLKAVAFGTLAERLVVQPLGSRWCFEGFLALPGNAKQPVLHIQDFQQD